MRKSLRILLSLLLIAAGLVLVGVALPGPAQAAPPVLPPRPTLTSTPLVTPAATEPPDTPAPTPEPAQPTPTPAPVLPAAGVTAPAWPGLLLGAGLVVLGGLGLILAKAWQRR